MNKVYASEIIAKMVESEAHFLMPELLKIVKIFATMPTTSAQAERSFSTLRRLKTYSGLLDFSVLSQKILGLRMLG